MSPVLGCSYSAFGAPCSVRNIRRGHPPYDGHPDNPQAPQAQASSQAQQQAQSDLATLQHDDNFASDLRPLSSDAHQAGTDLAFAKATQLSEPTATTVLTVKIDATTVKEDATIVSLDLESLTGDIGTANHQAATA